MMFWSARQYSHCTCTCMSISVHSCVSFHTRVISGQLWFSFLSAYLTRAVRHWVKVSTPVLFFGIFLVHITLKYVNLNRMRFGPGYMSFESKQYVGQCRPELLFWTAGFEWLKHHKVGIFVEKVIRKGLQRARSLLSGTHSLQGNTIFHWVELTSTEEQLTKPFTSDQWLLISHWLGGCRVGFKFDWEKKMGKVHWNNWQQFPWTKKVVSRTATLLFDNAWILNLKQNTNVIFTIVRLRVQIRVRLDSPQMNWTSTREFLEVSYVFVWYKANCSVCWLSWELNLFMCLLLCDSLVIVVIDMLLPLAALSN